MSICVFDPSACVHACHVCVIRVHVYMHVMCVSYFNFNVVCHVVSSELVSYMLHVTCMWHVVSSELTLEFYLMSTQENLRFH